MAAAEKALWYIENHFASEVTLGDIAKAASVSQYHLSRLFQATTGWSVVKYLRARRLTEAAQMMADGARDILTVALASGYGSHEAFTRAFGEQFGVSPEEIRQRGSCESIKLVQAIRADDTITTLREPPRIETSHTLLVAGFSAQYNATTSAGIPALWQKLALSRYGRILADNVTYGVCYNDDDDGNFEYLAGFEVPSFSGRIELAHARIPAMRYAVARHTEHISSIRRTWRILLGTWLPEAGLELADAPGFERYNAFDPQTGMGDVEIWVPLAVPTSNGEQA
jgi:AraC family transcriptional regulator